MRRPRLANARPKLGLLARNGFPNQTIRKSLDRKANTLSLPPPHVKAHLTKPNRQLSTTPDLGIASIMFLQRTAVAAARRAAVAPAIARTFTTSIARRMPIF